MLIIRPYRKEDYQPLKENLSEAKMFDENWDSEENVNGMIKNDPNAVLVAEIDKIVVGSIYCVPFGPCVIHFYRLAVRKDYRKRGIASHLIEHAMDLAEKKGVKEIGLFVDSENEELQLFYKKRKFTTYQKSIFHMWKTLS